MIIKSKREVAHLLIASLCSLIVAADSFSIQAPATNNQQLSGKISAAKQQSANNHTSSASSALNQQQLEKQPPAVATKNLEAHLNDVNLDGEPRSSDRFESASSTSSSSPDHDETVPLATINNHSRNNQPQARPPQYVDVSNLVARNANGSSPLSLSSAASVQTGAAPLASGLQAKSRSGLPECAAQQDGHTIELTRKFDKRVRACKSPTDWTLLALQSERSGKAHYVVVCKCPTWAQLEGPYTHNHPPYANIPGIRVYGMLCAHQTARSSAQTYSAFNPSLNILPEFPWPEALNVLNTTNLLSTLDAQH